MTGFSNPFIVVNWLDSCPAGLTGIPALKTLVSSGGETPAACCLWVLTTNYNFVILIISHGMREFKHKLSFRGKIFLL
ncbi:hypothetical protein GFC01_16605 [Desulfofundulus thermobenzoicus]|uniref:Uncharacterized protein n=1 Tax=Desulfofundulus thermobenzoicus TaxID=29376 RepID=A0A6N7IUQ3_9FIRM|nr:hypothetical protein [Desulfofundulus thermobenzoicus]MQL53846.1 hypothetical protein [Desulfofundulus thermobenzoicus]